MVFFIIRHVLEMSKDMTMFSNVSVTQKGVITSFLIVHSSMAFDLNCVYYKGHFTREKVGSIMLLT